MKKKWNVLAYILAVVLIVGGLLALWLPNRNGVESTDATRPDTDPDAPFVDLPKWEKERILKAISAYKEEHPAWVSDEVFWYGELKPGQEMPLAWMKYKYGVQYYGTFGGYDIVLAPMFSAGMGEGWRRIGNYSFKYGDSFVLYAYKNGVVRPLSEVYNEGLLDDEQIGLIDRCYERFSNEIYPYWEHFKNRE